MQSCRRGAHGKLGTARGVMLGSVHASPLAIVGGIQWRHALESGVSPLWLSGLSVRHFHFLRSPAKWWHLVTTPPRRRWCRPMVSCDFLRLMPYNRHYPLLSNSLSSHPRHTFSPLEIRPWSSLYPAPSLSLMLMSAEPVSSLATLQSSITKRCKIFHASHPFENGLPLVYL
jgi:hypothetical protein